jgi:hypothetical protein
MAGRPRNISLWKVQEGWRWFAVSDEDYTMRPFAVYICLYLRALQAYLGIMMGGMEWFLRI